MSEVKKELLFSVTGDDCRFDYYRGSGNGGQKKQKTSSACRCTHIASGAVGSSQESRSQTQNRQIAFQRMAETKEFKLWHKLECSRRTGLLARAEEAADRAMAAENIRVDVKDERGLWVEEQKNE